MRRVCAITERRADYSKLRPVLQKMEKDLELELFLIVAGHHLLPELGHTVELVESDGFTITARVSMFSEKEKGNGAEMAKALGRAIIGVTEAIERIDPDIMLVGFDLGAHLAAAIAAAHMNILVGHIEGGEVTGSIDESLRHAITRFAHLHFASNDMSVQRLIRMGENPEYVFDVGCPSLDVIYNMEYIPHQELAQKFNLDLSQPLILVVQHPVTTEADKADEQIVQTLNAVKKARMQAIVIYPNIDAGGRSIIRMIESSKIQSYKNLSFDIYASLMKFASVIVGNSSSGIIEAPSLKLPAVNIGTRQQGRMQAENVINTDYNSEEIYNAIVKAIYDEGFRKKLDSCRNPYGDGKASQKIVKILKSVNTHDPTLIQKRLAY